MKNFVKNLKKKRGKGARAYTCYYTVRDSSDESAQIKKFQNFPKLYKNKRTQIPMKRAEAVKRNNDAYCTYYSERIFFNLVTDEKSRLATLSLFQRISQTVYIVPKSASAKIVSF